MAAEPSRGPAARELESLRIQRATQERKPSRTIPIVIGVGVVAAVAAGGWAIYSRTLGRPPEVQTAIVAVRQSGQPGVLLTGSGYVVTQHKYIVIGTKVLGQIVEEPIEEGQHVKRGDLLARIDDRDYQAQLKQATADRDLAQANVNLKRARALRLRELFREKVASRDSLDDAENQLSVAQAGVKRSEGAIDYARFNVSQCVIRSPINGIVLNKYRELGDTINYGGQIQAGGGATDIAQLADTDDMRAEIDINEGDISKVTMGEAAQVIPDSYPDRAFASRVVKIYPAADRQKGTVKVEVRLLEPDLAIVKPEMSAKVTFLASPAQKSQAPLVLVPKKAIVGEGSASSVWVVRDGIVARVQVGLGREFQDGIEVRSGLSGGEMVVVVPPAELRDGQRVTPAAS